MYEGESTVAKEFIPVLDLKENDTVGGLRILGKC
jgi:hypothetical protein